MRMMNQYLKFRQNPQTMTKIVSREDSDGDFWVTVGIMAAGGVIGSAISALSSAATQKLLTGSVNWKSVGVAAVSGFVSGAVSASPLGPLGQKILGGSNRFGYICC